MSNTTNSEQKRYARIQRRKKFTPFSYKVFSGAWYILASPKSAIFTTPCSSPSPMTYSHLRPMLRATGKKKASNSVA